MGVIYGTSPIISDNLSLCLDASHPDSNSTKMKDAIGSNDATNNGSTFVAATSYSSPAYYSFDGSNDYLNVSSPNSIVNFGTNPYTVEYWFNCYNPGSTLLDTRNSGSSTGSNWYIGIRGKQGDPESYVSRKHTWNNSNPLNYINASYRFPENEWSGWLHVVCLRQGTGSNEQKFYWNGEYIRQDTDDIDYNVSSDDLMIGRQGRLNTGYFEGYMSILRIYNGKALTAAEVKQNFDAHKGRFGL